MRGARLPWWLIILLIGLVIALYGIVTTPIYHEALIYVTGDPAVSTTDFEKVNYEVTIAGKTQAVGGTLTAQDAQSITVRTVDPQTSTIDKARVSDIQHNGDQVVVTTAPQTIAGIFYTQTATQYRIQLADGQIISVTKLDVRATQKLTPDNCQPDTQGSCQISVTVPSSTISGKLLADTVTSYTIQTVDPVFVIIQRAAITTIISEKSAKCALNNLGSCQEGIFLTLFLTLTSYALALVIGLVIALMRISSQPVLKNFAILYVEVVRGIPILVILLLFYFAIGPWIRDNLNVPMPEVLRAILGLSFAYGAFLAEIFRAGIQSISRGQMEAARSLGMNYFQAMRHIVLPQAIRVVLPPIGNDFIAMLKDTSLVAAISLSEMTLRAELLAAKTSRPFQAFITIAVLYLIMTLILSFIVRVIENRVRLPA